MATARTYSDLCGVARALDVVGERWALLIVRELLLGPKRFTDLRAGIPHASPNVLSERLRELERDGVVRRRKLGPPSGARVYELTERGRQLDGVVLELARWGSLAPAPPDAEMSVDSHVLALRTLFDPAAADDDALVVELQLDDDRFRAEVTGGRFAIARGDAADPDAVIVTDRPTLRALLWAGRNLAEALRAGDVEVHGDRRAATRFLALFPLPAPAAA